jgi:hypothetical protein
MTVPDEFVGAWQRQSIELDGREPTETAAVIWLQTQSAFADLRLDVHSGAALACFAGHTSWQPPRLHWRHDLDLAGSAHADIGAVAWLGDDLVESGETDVDGAVVPYVEVWRRLPGAEGTLHTDESPEHMHVVVGVHEMFVEDHRSTGGLFTACYSRRGNVVLAIDGEQACA